MIHDGRLHLEFASLDEARAEAPRLAAECCEAAGCSLTGPLEYVEREGVAVVEAPTDALSLETLRAKWSRNPDFARAYDELAPDFAAARAELFSGAFEPDDAEPPPDGE